MPIPRLKRKLSEDLYQTQQDEKLDDVEMPGFHGNLHNQRISSGYFSQETSDWTFNVYKRDVSTRLTRTFQEIDATLFLFQERRALRRWKASMVAFMSWVFSNQIKCSYSTFKKDKTKFKVEGFLHNYGTVFDCSGLKHHKDVEPFANLIPQIVKAVQSAENKKHLNVRTYKAVYVPVPFINKISSDCRVYALKFIECHTLGLDFTLVNDDNIREARQKITYDLWEAANDPELMLRMSKYTPTKTITSNVAELV
uniref:Ubiquitin-like protease family profile domain-containing protein n=1 Tax=Brassica oleracea TaxID=3712 RepID=A0A3P6DKT4_BRAOL|nr:unnamed protein product [Brassica oleracea]